ncbi:mitogen-activated protein kinase kinase kinase 7-interacting protein 3 homolog isoform X3 [Aedes aegypti]|uniref:Uncharacterized protein n=1 Tax=Aedes aegypti TaxID=7159 RepID=A0A6I8U7I1_AEDAE|nr:mitogen-activated protein kinase kinase kinase 7-interacting protein 3 homolog isoform X3 [Aedes aegypti]
MATNPPKKPPENDTYYTTGFPDSSCAGSPTSLLKKRRSTCSCSNIAIMQLFHEMKQKFPKVPDHVVSDLVTANCHNRPACIDSLEKAVAGTPVTAQAYPSQSIHSTSLKRRINERKMSKLESSLSGGSSGSSSRESSVDKSSKCVGDAAGSSYSINNNSRIPNSTTTIGGSSGDLPRDSGSVNNVADNHPMMTVYDSNNNRVAPSRPTTLPFSGPRPTRVAPLPPISASQTTSSDIGETINVQLNVTVSPVASRSPLGQRHTSTLQLQPEPPYSRELAQASSRFNTPGPLPPGANSRSSTSVNLTLRQPSESPQSPIHIHASPLKYTAKGFNAQSGIQSKLEITFQDGFGSISAMRTHVPGFDPPIASGSNSSSSHSTSIPHRGQLQENLYRDQQQQQQMVAGVTVNAGAQVASAHNESDGLTKEQLHQNYLTEVAITHQLDQKNRLSIEVERYRQQLRSIRREIDVLQRPLPPQIAEDLHREVQLLRQEADLMQKEVDSADLTTGSSSISDGLHALSIEGSPILPAGSIANRPPRPPRPPPPRIPLSLQHQPPSAPIANASSYAIDGRSLSAPAGTASYPVSGSGGDLSTGEQWTCSLCTFQNHELMTTCEVCSLPKVSVTSGQDIHIYLSPGQNKIVHSWIVS